MSLLVCVFLPMLCAPAVYLLRRKSAKCGDACTVLVSFAVTAAAIVAVAQNSAISVPGFCGLGANFQTGGFQSVLLVLCALVFPLSALSSHAYFGDEPRVGRYQAFFLLTYGALMGVFASSDLFTTYVFFEIMSMTSWVWVAQNETPESRRAADTYLAIAVIGGLTMLFGLFYLEHMFGTLAFDALAAGRDRALSDPGALIAGFCLLTGFGAKAGMYPLHIWLPKAHPVAPAPASALLSGILTKAGIFGILVCVTGLFRGSVAYAAVILVLGVITMLLGALLAVFSNDLKRTLACSSLSQIGFILIGCALLGLDHETNLAAGGVLLHAVNHALIKLVLFLCAGTIYRQNHTLDLNRLRGAGRGNSTLLLCFAVGALSISGVPGFGGYISKTLLHEAIAENAAALPGALGAVLSVTEWLFLIAGGLTLAYMGKLFVRLFLERGDCAPVRLDWGTATAITLPAAALVVCGAFPRLTYARIGNFAAASLGTSTFAVRFFSGANLLGAGISLLIGALVYLLIVRGALTDHKAGLYRTVRAPLTLEDNVYKPLLSCLALIGAFLARLIYSLTDWFVLLADRVMRFARPKRIAPKRDDHFAHYSRKYVRMGRIEQTLAFELLLFGAGVVFTLLFLLIRL